MCPVGLVVVTSGVGRKGLAAAVAENGTAAHGLWIHERLFWNSCARLRVRKRDVG